MSIKARDKNVPFCRYFRAFWHLVWYNILRKERTFIFEFYGGIYT
jgi:hypothetical protein